MIGKISGKVLGKLYRALVLVMVLSLLLPYVALGDELVTNTDGDAVFAENTDKTLGFGTACKGVSTKYATLAIERTNNLSNHPDKIFASGANVDLSVVSVSSTALSVTLPSGGNGDVTTDANWTDQSSGAITADRVEVPVKLDTTNLTNGSTFNGTIKFKATGQAADGTTTLSREVELKVSATVGSTSCEQATTTSLSSSKNPSKYAESVTFTATVSPSAATGNVEFFNGTTSLGTAALSSGNASLSTSSLAVGTHSITAKYLGATGYGSSTSSATSQVVAKATATVTLTGLSHTYNGEAKAAGATTEPSGLSVSFAYSQNGNPVAAADVKNAGDYNVVATVNSTNYQGSASGTLTIGKATPSITWENPADIVYGTALSATQLNATSSVDGSFVYTPAAGAKLDAGQSQNLKVEFTPTNANYSTASKTVQINVNKANQAISFSFAGLEAKTYGDAAFSIASYASADSGLAVSFSSLTTSVCTVSGSTVTIAKAGTCEIRASQAGDGNYNAATSVDKSFSIAKKAATVQLIGDLSRTYNGQAHSLTASTTPADLAVTITYNGSATAPINAGSYTVVATINDDNYSGTDQKTLVISKKALDVTADPKSKKYGEDNPTLTYSFDNSDFVGNDTAANSVSGAPELSTTAVKLSDVGTYTITTALGSLESGNYRFVLNNGTLTIERAPATIDVESETNTTYDGSAKSVTAVTTPAGLSYSVTYNGSSTAPTNAGTYSVAVEITNPNYVAATDSGTLHIAKATPDLSWSSPADITYGTALGSAQLNADADVAGSFAYTVVGQAGDASGKVLDAGSYTLRAVFSPTDANNYNSASKDVAITVNKANQTINFTAISGKTFGDADFQASATGGASGNTVTFAVKAASNSKCTVTSAGMVTITGAGSCTLVASQAGNNNYNAAPDAEQTFNIAKAQAVVTLSNLTGHIYDGTAKAATAATNPAGLSVEITYNGSTTAPSAVGSYSVVATINDANYQGSATGTLTIGAWTLKGFYSPVDMGTSTTTVYNTVKNGSTVPLKFEVFKGTTELTDTAVVSALAKQITCGTGSVDDIEVLATGSTSLRYDTTSGQFIYNWKTPSIANNCYSVTMTTQDGSKITAHFKLK